MTHTTGHFRALPDEPVDEYGETIQLDEADIMETHELRQLADPDCWQSADDDETDDDQA